MKTKRGLAALLSCCIISGALPGFAAGSGTEMYVDVNEVIKNASAEVYGISTDYSVNTPLLTDPKNLDATPNVKLIQAMNEYSLPLVRIGEGASKGFEWKQAIGPMEERTEQTLWSVTNKIAGGPVELVKALEAIDKDVKYSFTLNMTTDTAEDAADFAEFMTGAADTEWGAKRAEYGYSEPFDIRLYELGNEVDYGSGAITASEYIAKSKEFIAAIKVVDPDAKFAAIANTAAYNGVQWNDPSNWAEWHNAVLSDPELASEIDYISVHAYYSDYKNELMDKLITKVSDDIKTATGSDRIKIYLSEHGVYYNPDNNKNPHNMESVLETANIYSRMFRQPSLEMATYHGIDSSEWKNVTTNSSGEMYLNGIGQLLKLFKEYGVGDVLSSSFTGFSKGVRSTSSGAAVRDSDGKINLIFTNDSASELPVNVSFSDGGEYKIVKETKLVGSGVTADTNEDLNQIYADTYDYENGDLLSSYTLPAYSVCAVTVEKAADVSNTELLKYDFSSSEGISGVSGTGEGTYSVENGSLKLTAYNTDANYGYNYIYLTNENTNSAFRFDADITVNGIADADSGEMGVILNADADSGAPQNANMIKLTGSGIKDVAYESGAEGNPAAEGAYSLAEGAVHITADIKDDGTVDVYVNGSKEYSRSGGLKSNSGYIGFMFADVNCTIDNVVISKYDSEEIPTVTTEEVFTYEENFDGIENGKLPDGFKAMSSRLSAGVEDGELVVSSSDWYKPKFIKIGAVGNVERAGLTLEADVTLVSYNEGARADGARNKAGFAYMIDGPQYGTGGFLSFYPQLEFTEASTASKPTAGTDSGFTDNIKTNLKLVFSNSKSPDVYVNGTKLSYYNATNITQNEGAVGLMVLASKVKFDNIKITGVRKNTYKESETITKLVDFRYEENFDNVTEGTLPAGWKIIDTSKTTASVAGGELVLESTEWWSPKAVLIGGLDNVLRDGLVMEADMTLVSYNTNARNSGARNKAGFAYMINDSGKMSSGGLLSWHSQAEFTEIGTTSRPTSGSGDFGEGNNGFISKEKVRFRLEFSGTNSPEAYVNNTHCGNYYNITGTTANSGGLGLMAQASKVKFDNVVITGKRMVTTLDNCTYDAYFTTASTDFDTVDEAVAAVKVTETDVNGTASDITKSAEITSSLDGTNCTIKVTCFGKDVKTLKCTVGLPVSEGFIYEENFDTVDNGKLPEGWTLYGTQANAKVQDGALIFNANGWYENAYLFFDITDVQRKGLTFEFDITRNGAPGGNSNNSRAGFAYMASAADGAVISSSYCALYTDKKIGNNKQQGWTFDGGSNIGFEYSNLEGGQLLTGATHHVKFVFNNDTQSPVIYVDGVEPGNSYRAFSNDMVKSGLIGLYAFSAKVKIDNVKVSGTRLKARTKNSLITINKAVQGEKLSLAVSAQNANGDIAAAMMLAAVYEKGTTNLVAVSPVINWNTSQYTSIDTVISVDGITDYSADKYDIKLIAMDKSSFKPVAVNGRI